MDTVSSTQNFNILQLIMNSNITKLLFIFLAICCIIILVIFGVIYIIKKTIGDADYIKIGNLVIKSEKERKSSLPSNSKIISLDAFLNVLDLVLSIEIEKIITNSVNAVNDINRIETEYENRTNFMFEKIFERINNEYHEKLVRYVCSVLQCDAATANDTKEYYFISDMLEIYKELWNDQVKDITRRNGFVEFLHDKSKIAEYIEELESSIYSTIDLNRLETTKLNKSEIDSILKICGENNYIVLEKMFMTLATMKSNMITKRKDKLNFIENTMKDTVVSIINKVRDRLAKGDLFTYATK
jgi:hypothetical protein